MISMKNMILKVESGWLDLFAISLISIMLPSTFAHSKICKQEPNFELTSKRKLFNLKKKGRGKIR